MNPPNRLVEEYRLALESVDRTVAVYNATPLSLRLSAGVEKRAAYNRLQGFCNAVEAMGFDLVELEQRTRL